MTEREAALTAGVQAILDEAEAVDAAENQLYGAARGDELPPALRTRGILASWADVPGLSPRTLRWFLVIPGIVLVGQVLDSLTFILFAYLHPDLLDHERNPIIHWLATELTAWSVVVLKVGVAMFVLHLWRQRTHLPPAIALAIAGFAAVSGLIGFAFNLSALLRF